MCEKYNFYGAVTQLQLQYVPTTPCAKKGNMKPRHDRDSLKGTSSLTELVSSLCKSYRRNVLDIKHVLSFSLNLLKTVMEMCARCAQKCT